MINYLLEDEYEMKDENELNDIMNDIPTTLIESQVRDQIDNLGENNNDKLTSLIEESQNYMEKYKDDPDLYRPILLNLEKSLTTILYYMQDNLGIGIDIREDDLEDLIELSLSIYKTLVLKFQLNVTKFLYKFIVTNKEEYGKIYKDEKRKSVSALSNKTRINDEDILDIITNIPYVIRDIADECREMDGLTFIRTCGVNVTEAGETLEQLYTSGRICDTFTGVYFSKILEDESLLDTITINVKNILIKNYIIK